MKTIPFVLFIAANTMLAQTVVSLQVGTNSRTGFFSLEEGSPDTQDWKDGTSVSASIDYFLKRSIALSANVEADVYPFDTFRSFAHAAGRMVAPGMGISGDACQVYRISLEAKLFFSPNNSRSLYLVTGISNIMEHIGQIRFMNGSMVESTIDGQSDNYLAHSFGLGFRYLIWDEFGFDCTGKWYSNYSTHFHTSLNFGVAYVL
jgi:hypothetical protein